jgi:acetate kinase
LNAIDKNQTDRRSRWDTAKQFLLTINAGSSSIKFALFRVGSPLYRTWSGQIERIRLANAMMIETDVVHKKTERRAIVAPDHGACFDLLADRVEQVAGESEVAAVGHRVVHGGKQYSSPQRITPEVMNELGRLSPYDPEHMPSALVLIEAFAKRYPKLPQVACFDTTFHRDMPRIARLLPIPRRYYADGVRRYGFHGLSYSFLMEELARLAGHKEASGRVILAHLGNGASMAAVRGGTCMDTTMAFTPTSGLPMSTRSGDLDPGIVSYLARTEGMSADQFHELVNTRSGLLGVSEISPDMRELLAREQTDERAAEAVALFCYQARKWIGAFAAVLNGLDTVVFSGGIGENSPEVRGRICEGLGFLGLAMDPASNTANALVISKDSSSVVVRVIRTDEEAQIAASVYQLLA